MAFFVDPVLKLATLSEDRVYRHTLIRRWGDGLPVTFIMLNPSTADADNDDPTIRKCIKFAKRWKYDALFVVNLFDFRATKPKDLFKAPFPISRDCDLALINNCKLTHNLGGKVIAAWGAHGTHLRRDREIKGKLNALLIPLYALHITASGQPGHPLFLPDNTKPFLWT